MRSSDWSSDVCSSDLVVFRLLAAFEEFRDLRFGVGPALRVFLEVFLDLLVDGAVHEHRQDHRRGAVDGHRHARSEEHTSELQSLMRISYAVFCLKKKNTT